MNEFNGFESPKQNWSKLPHQMIDALPQIKTLGEMKVILYTLRHTWGYRDDYKKITLDEFQHGRKRKNGSRIDNGTGLTKPTIVDGIKRAIKHGFLFEHIDTSDSARTKKFYSLTEEGLKDFTPDVKNLYPRGKEVLHRTEKETLERNIERNLLPANAEKGDSQKDQQSDWVDILGMGRTDPPPSVSVLDPNSTLIPKMEKILQWMAEDGLVETKKYDDQTIGEDTWELTWYYWVDGGQPVENIPFGLAKQYGYMPEVSESPPSVSANDAVVRPILSRLIKDGIIEMMLNDKNIFIHCWADSGQPVESIPLEMAKKYGYIPPEVSGPPENTPNVLVDTPAPYDHTQGGRIPDGEIAIENDQPEIFTQSDLDKVNSGEAKSGPPPIVFGSFNEYGGRVPIAIENDQTEESKRKQAPFCPEPQALADYASDVARQAVEKIDQEIMGDSPETPEEIDSVLRQAGYDPDEVGQKMQATADEALAKVASENEAPDDDLTNVFGPNLRQAEIDNHKDKPKLSADELFLAAVGAGVDQEVRYHISRIRSQDWRVKGVLADEIEIGIAQFLQVTDFPVPGAASTRKLWVHGIREHLGENLFEGRLGELYKAVWADKRDAVNSGELTLTHPKAFTKMMYGIIQRERGVKERPDRQKLIDLMLKDGLIEVREIGDAVGFFYIDTGNLVGDDIPEKYIKQYYKE